MKTSRNLTFCLRSTKLAPIRLNCSFSNECPKRKAAEANSVKTVGLQVASYPVNKKKSCNLFHKSIHNFPTIVIAFGEDFKIVKLDGIPSENARQEFVVRHVLKFGAHNASTVLEQLFVVPVRIDLGQFGNNSVVFSHEHGMD